MTSVSNKRKYNVNKKGNAIPRGHVQSNFFSVETTQLFLLVKFQLCRNCATLSPLYIFGGCDYLPFNNVSVFINTIMRSVTNKIKKSHFFGER